MKVINLSEHSSLLNQYLKEIRSVDIQKDSMRFRRNIERIGQIMAIEVSRALDYQPEDVQTPLGVAHMPVAQDAIVVASVMRAGLPLHIGFLDMYDHAENAFLSAYRRVNEKGELEIVSEYMAAPKLDGKTLLLVDPMLATGMSMQATVNGALNLPTQGGQQPMPQMCCVIGTNQAIDFLKPVMPDNVTLWCAAVDPTLNEKKYIVPGLGDAGDLCFGEKL